MENRIVWVDWAKFICMYLVIVGHLANREPLYINDLLYHFHMPVFFYISGYLFKKGLCFKDFIKAKIKSLLLPYVTINILVVILMIPEYLSAGVDIKHLLFMLVTVDSLHAGGATWFLICLFFTEIISYFVLKYKPSTSVIIALFFACLATIPYIPKGIYFKIDVAFMAVPFFVGGFLCKEYKLFEVVKSNIILDMVLLVLCMAVPLFNGKPGMYSRNMGYYPLLYYPFVFIYIFTIQRLLARVKKLPQFVKNISNGTILYIGLQGVGIVYWNKLLFKARVYDIIPRGGYVDCIFGSMVIMLAVYPFMVYILSKYPHFFGRKKRE